MKTMGDYDDFRLKIDVLAKLLGAKAEKIQCIFKDITDIYLNHVMNYTLLTTGKYFFCNDIIFCLRYGMLFILPIFICDIKFYLRYQRNLISNIF